LHGCGAGSWSIAICARCAKRFAPHSRSIRSLQVARRIRLDCVKAVTTLREYNHVIARRDDYLKLQREAPNLVPLYASQIQHLAAGPSIEPAQALRQHIVGELKLPPSTWARLHNTPPRWLYLARHFYRASIDDAAADLLQIMDALGCTRWPPNWFLWQVLQIFGHAHSRRFSYVERVRPLRLAFGRVARLIETAQPDELAAIRSQLFEVLYWIAQNRKAVQRSSVTRAGWKWFVKRATAWRADLEREAGNAGLHWQVPAMAQASYGCYHAVPLRDSAELLEESRTMRHCAQRYAQACHAGTHLVVSIRQRGRERPVATALLRREDQDWTLAQVVGTANSRARPAAIKLALEVQAWVNAATCLERVSRPEEQGSESAESASSTTGGNDGGD
jgi:hypothetical protein